MNRGYLFICCGVLLMALLAGCGERSYKDGVYAGKSGADDTGAWGEVTITIAGARITGCQFITRRKDGTVKDENYGKINGAISNQDYYNEAQLAVRAMAQYARDLTEKQRLRDIDAVSGATIAYNQFIEAVENALETAGK
jgi:major membrane immunogen (membrane-anchored lipoprotein)